MICDEKEICSKAKQIQTFSTEVNKSIGNLSKILKKATEVAVKDKNISSRLLEMSEDLKTLQSAYMSNSQNVSGELRTFAREINQNDNFEFNAEYDNVLLAAVDNIFSL